MLVVPITGHTDDAGERLCVAVTSVKIHDEQGKLVEGAQAAQFGNAVTFSGLSTSKVSQAVKAVSGSLLR